MIPINKGKYWYDGDSELLKTQSDKNLVKF